MKENSSMTLSKILVIKTLNSLLQKRITLGMKKFTSLEEELYDIM